MHPVGRYPLYMKHLRADLKRIGLRVQFSRVDTDQPVRINAARLRHEILEIAQVGFAARACTVATCGHVRRRPKMPLSGGSLAVYRDPHRYLG